MAEDKPISVKEAARRLNVSQQTIIRMIDAGEIRAFRVMRQWRILSSEIDRIIRGDSNESENEE